MKVLVTGGAGFVGSHVVDALVQQGHDVCIVDDLSTGKRENVNPAARLYHVDLRSPELESVFAKEKPDLVDHHAARASVRESMVQPILYADVNILGSLNLLECCRKHSVAKIVYISTGGAVYGDPRYLPADEDHPINPLDPYGASKACFEHYLPLYRKHYGVGFTILRYANIYGPRQDPLGEAGVVAIFVGQMLRGQQAVINGSGEQERDFLYVGDVAMANMAVLTKGDGEVYNIGTGVGTSINEVFDRLRTITGYDKVAVHGPAKVGEVFKTFLKTDKANHDLGWHPEVSLDQGLRQTADYFRKHR
jgi:UDP-glucose 4-epimerase